MGDTVDENRIDSRVAEDGLVGADRGRVAVVGRLDVHRQESANFRNAIEHGHGDPFRLLVTFVARVTFTLAADVVFKAIGQVFLAKGGDGVTLNDGRIEVDGEGRTSLTGVWAGGDCVAGGQDLTVTAVEDGKLAALSMDRALRAL